MTINLDLSIFCNPVPYIVLYAMGLIVAVNVSAVHYKRNGDNCGICGPEYVFLPIFWPVFILVWVLLLPSRLIK